MRLNKLKSMKNNILNGFAKIRKMLSYRCVISELRFCQYECLLGFLEQVIWVVVSIELGPILPLLWFDGRLKPIRFRK